MTDDLSIIENGDVNPLDNNVVDSEVIVPEVKHKLKETF